MPELIGRSFLLRPCRRDDAEAIARAANNPAIARNLIATFPSPYTVADAHAWIANCEHMPQGELRLTVDVDGAASGGIGLHSKAIWSPYTFEIGYWLGESHWDKGIMTEAVGLMAQYAFESMDARRLQAFVYDWNPASARVLEKNGFALEGRLRGAVHKDGRTGDCLAYGRLR